jgi:hypothetical protein
LEPELLAANAAGVDMAVIAVTIAATITKIAVFCLNRIITSGIRQIEILL